MSHSDMSNAIQQLGEAAQILRGYAGGECSVGFRLQTHLDQNGNASVDYCANWGDVLSDGPWKWGCAHGATIEDCLRNAFEEINQIKTDQGRARRELEARAAKIGCILVEKPTQPAAVD